MRFGFVHRLLTDALAVLGIFALVSSGKVNFWFSIGACLSMALALGLPERLKQVGLMKLLGVVFPLSALGIQLARLALGADPIPVVVEFAAILQVIRLATRRGAIHDHQVILLALLHLIAGTVLGGGLTYALSLIGFLILTPGALVLSHLRREVEGNYRQGARDRTGMPVDVPRILRSRRVISRGFLGFTCILSIPVFVFTAVLFVMFPRVGFTWLVVPPIEPRRMVGFSDQVDLGGVGVIRSDPTLVMRVRPDDMGDSPRVRRNLYLRGAAFDTYDGRTWRRQATRARQLPSFGRTVVLRRAPRPLTDRKMSIDLEPIQPQVVFVPGEAIAVRVETSTRSPTHLVQAPISFGHHGELVYTTVEQTGLQYEVFSPPKGLVLPERLSAEHADKYLTLPSNLSPRIYELASQLTAGHDEPVEIARQLEGELRRGYRYDLNSPSGSADDPLADFLFESKRGHCEFYSTAMAVMLRTRGVPSRNVTGFVGGTYNRFGDFYAVRQGDAHSWVEAYLPRLGWTRFDPTPPSDAAPQAATEGALALMREMVEALAQGWNQNVEGFDLNQQIGLLRKTKGFLSGVFLSEPQGGEGRVGRERSVRVVPLVLGAVLVCGFGVYLWRRRRQRSAGGERGSARSEQRSVDLARRLDSALRARGVARPSGTPAKTHAEALVLAGHPVGQEALELSTIYLDVRYGSTPMTLETERSFRVRVQKLRRVESGNSAEASP